MTEMPANEAAQRFVTLAEDSLVGAKELAGTVEWNQHDVDATIALAQVNATLAVAAALMAIDGRMQGILETLRR